MAKYIINIDNENAIVDGHLSIPLDLSIRGSEGETVELNLIVGNNLTPYEEPDIDAVRKEARVDKAYQQGLEDARNRKATCEFCEYAGNDESDEPCVRCCCGYINMFRPKGVVPKADSRIRKKIEGIMESLDCTISDFEKAIEEMKNGAD